MDSETEEYKGHRIEIRAREAIPEALVDDERAREATPKLLVDDERTREATPQLLIDDEPIRYAQLQDGSYLLYEYAYDWPDSLIDLARRFIDYRDKADQIRRVAENDEEA